jgi:hypothetical protein
MYGIIIGIIIVGIYILWTEFGLRDWTGWIYIKKFFAKVGRGLKRVFTSNFFQQVVCIWVFSIVLEICTGLQSSLVSWEWWVMTFTFLFFADYAFPRAEEQKKVEDKADQKSVPEDK